MHALRRFLQDGLDARGWKPADLYRASGLTRQRIYQMLDDDRDVLPAMPARETLEGIAGAFRVSMPAVVAVVFEAMGYSLAEARAAVDLSSVSNDELIEEIASRLDRSSVHRASGAPGLRALPASPPVPDDVAARRERQPSTARERRRVQDEVAGDPP